MQHVNIKPPVASRFHWSNCRNCFIGIDRNWNVNSGSLSGNAHNPPKQRPIIDRQQSVAMQPWIVITSARSIGASEEAPRPNLVARVFFSPSSVDILGVLTVVVKHRCPIEVLHRGGESLTRSFDALWAS